MDDGLQPYENGLKNLFILIRKQDAIYLDVLVYQARLVENIKRTRLYGGTDVRDSNRIEIIDGLNRLLLPIIGKSFNELCGLDELLSVPALRSEHPDEIFVLTRAYIMSVQEAIRYPYNLFSSEQDIWPEQCDRSIGMLQKAHTAIPSTLLDLSLMAILYSVEEYMKELIKFLREFRRICRRPRSRIQTKWEEIDRTFDSLIQSIAEVNVLIDTGNE